MKKNQSIRINCKINLSFCILYLGTEICSGENVHIKLYTGCPVFATPVSDSLYFHLSWFGHFYHVFILIYLFRVDNERTWIDFTVL